MAMILQLQSAHAHTYTPFRNTETTASQRQDEHKDKKLEAFSRGAKNAKHSINSFLQCS